MTRRVVLILTTAAALAAGAGAASAATSHASSSGVASVPDHQFCLLFYRSGPPQHLCLNW